MDGRHGQFARDRGIWPNGGSFPSWQRDSTESRNRPVTPSVNGHREAGDSNHDQRSQATSPPYIRCSHTTAAVVAVFVLANNPAKASSVAGERPRSERRPRLPGALSPLGAPTRRASL